MDVVIVGNGVAGMEAALTVRAREPDWKITIVSEESDHFFSRTALMYVLSGQMSHQDIEPLERDAYARLTITRVRERAVGVDTAARCLLLAGGGRLSYDRLVLACGSRPRPGPWEGSELRGVGHFVTLQDLQWLETEVHGGSATKAKEIRATSEESPYRVREAAAVSRGRLAQQPVVIGGGLIGVEVVETFLAAGLRPKFLIREEWFWPIALDATESAWIAEAMRHHGVDVQLETNVTKLLPDEKGNVAKVLTEEAELDADLVVVAIGVMPNTDWLGGAVDVDKGGGIVVDDGLRTSVPEVHAAGDCASVRWFNGWVRPEQLWYTARDQGRAVGRALLGDDVSYARPTWYNAAKLMDIEYTTAGLVNMKVAGEQNFTYIETGPVRSTTRIVHVDGRVIGMNFLGRRWDHAVCNRWIEERRSVEYVLDHLDEANFDTEFVPPLRIPTSARPTAQRTP